MKLHDLHPISRGILVAFVGVLIYLLTVNAFQAGRPANGMMGRFFAAPNPAGTGIAAVLGLAGMFVLSLFLFKRHEAREAPKEHPVKDEFSIMKRALTKDETALLEKVREAPSGITQDSLRFRLDWSKAKVSTMLANLDRMGLVQRERYGKTYMVRYQAAAD